MRELMLDLETLGTSSHAVVVSIGAVQFDITNDEMIGDLYYRNVDADSCVKAGLKIDGGCVVDFWFKQNDAARHALLDNKKSLFDACTEFGDFMKRNKIETIWGNGSSFDCVIIRNAFEAVGVPFPIPFWGDRDVRTLVQLGRKLGLKTDKTERIGTAHNALDDAKWQVSYTTQIFKRLKEKQW
jgi:hypothetical protein